MPDNKMRKIDNVKEFVKCISGFICVRLNYNVFLIVYIYTFGELVLLQLQNITVERYHYSFARIRNIIYKTNAACSMFKCNHLSLVICSHVLLTTVVLGLIDVCILPVTFTC